MKLHGYHLELTIRLRAKYIICSIVRRPRNVGLAVSVLGLTYFCFPNHSFPVYRDGHST